jgi:opacity protein-like surface antigen
MIINKAIKPVIVSLALLSSSIAGAKMLSFMPDSTATDYNYIGVRAGGVFPNNTQGNTDLQSVSGDSTYTAGFSVGRKIQDRFAVELEYMNRGESNLNSSATTGGVSNSWGVKANTLMLNASADIITDTPGRPYVKFGLGASRNEASEYKYSDDTVGSRTWGSKVVTKFAWQAALGVNVSVTKDADANIEYAYIDRGEFRTKDTVTRVNTNGNISTRSGGAKLGKLREQVLTVGVKYKF